MFRLFIPFIIAILTPIIITGCGADLPVRPVEREEIKEPKEKVAEYQPLSDLITAYDGGDYSSVMNSPPVENLSLSEQTLQKFLHLGAQFYVEPIAITENQFTEIDPQYLPPQRQLEYQLFYATFLRLSDAGSALQQLNRPAVSSIVLPDHPELFANFYRLRAEVYNQMGSILEAVNDYITREQFITGKEQVAANQITLWMLLSHIPHEELDNIILGESGLTLRGWADLIAITRELTRYPDEFSEQISLWKRRYPIHPAQEELINDLLERSQKLILKPKQIAILLPLSGTYAKAAAALRDGILTSYLADPHKDEVTLRFYDTAGKPKFIETVFQQAVNDGAEFILGPLNKKVVQQLISIGADYSIPTLTLNLTGEINKEGSYQFSLSPEGEAINAANRAWHEGYSRISMLLPENQRGKRMAQAFQKQWAAYGGTIANIAYYNPKLNDFATPIKSMLDISRSESRRKALRRTIGERFEFTPRRRDDIELIFLSAQPRQARIIKPQLRFHHASDIPVMASSHLYTGKPDRQLDRDMDGILFEDMPWNIRQSEFSKANSYLNAKYSGQLKRLVAMGIDSYQIIPLLPILDAYPNEFYQGESGQLSLNYSNQIERKLPWSQFKQGTPRPVKDFVYTEPTIVEKDEQIDETTIQ